MILGWPWPILRQGQIWSPIHLNGEVLQSHLMGKTCSKGLNWLNNCVYEKKFTQRGLSAPAPGLYICIWPLFSNIFFSETAWPINAKFHLEPPWEGGKKVYIIGPGHMTKMAAMPIYDKNLQKSSPTELIVLWSWNLAWSITVQVKKNPHIFCFMEKQPYAKP